ncbi:hypothetical protein AVEN_128073-1 [Araneus ventricosus]|uniref:Uncharacterized protein n=1 Tax=Araneus ventricosus TaxID=182803 RepID=A0A4Y1ZZH8_ARAVE|nr:hypothetical protein AVEN_128073-1 [Araneus ventricosus]
MISRRKNKHAIHALKKECNVLVYKLSPSDVSSLQKNPILVKESPDLCYRSRGKECSVLLSRLENNEKLRTRKPRVSYLCKRALYVLIKNVDLSLQAERKNELKLSILLGYEIYLELFTEYLNDLQKNKTEMEEELSRRNISKDLIVPNDDKSKNSFYGNESETVNKNLVVWLIEKYREKIMNVGKIRLEKQWKTVKNAATDAIEKKEKEMASARRKENESVSEGIASEGKEKEVIVSKEDEGDEKEMIISEEVVASYVKEKEVIVLSADEDVPSKRKKVMKNSSERKKHGKKGRRMKGKRKRLSKQRRKMRRLLLKSRKMKRLIVKRRKMKILCLKSKRMKRR